MLDDLARQLNAVYLFLTKNEIAVASNYHSISDGEMRWSGFDSSFVSLARNVEHTRYYSSCVRDRQYNFILLDGGLVQLQYRIRNDKICEHRLLFMHSPDVPDLSAAPEEYADLMYGDIPFGDQIESQSPPMVVRFDFNDDESRHRERAHPYSHLTLGNIGSCRIPVKAPLTPFRFFDFILRNFYYQPFSVADGDSLFACPVAVSTTMTETEAALMHVNW
ncbi:MAG: DUF2290 domain-containing protein [Pseudomonadales bacterium]